MSEGILLIIVPELRQVFVNAPGIKIIPNNMDSVPLLDGLTIRKVILADCKALDLDDDLYHALMLATKKHNASIVEA